MCSENYNFILTIFVLDVLDMDPRELSLLSYISTLSSVKVEILSSDSV